MEPIRDHLSKIERKLEALFEGSVTRLFPGRMNLKSLASRLVEAMHAGLRQDDRGVSWAPNMYVVFVHPQEAKYFDAQPALVNELTQALAEAGVSAGLVFSGSVILRVEADPLLAIDEINVQVHNTLVDLPQTSVVELQVHEVKQDFLPSAYLVVDGTQVFSIQKPVINIGRRVDNDLVIDDPRISRIHAQLRWTRDSYVIFDLNSSGGTWVNDLRVNQATLSPGDVLSLAGVPLVFGIEDEGVDRTQELDV